ncbi:MAG: hypothetical protein AVDCRST_MAG59-2882, partial [uncultured Thermomicrobiales bacterium]
ALRHLRVRPSPLRRPPRPVPARRNPRLRQCLGQRRSSDAGRGRLRAVDCARCPRPRHQPDPARDHGLRDHLPPPRVPRRPGRHPRPRLGRPGRDRPRRWRPAPPLRRLRPRRLVAPRTGRAAGGAGRHPRPPAPRRGGDGGRTPLPGPGCPGTCGVAAAPSAVHRRRPWRPRPDGGGAPCRRLEQPRRPTPRRDRRPGQPRAACGGRGGDREAGRAARRVLSADRAGPGVDPAVGAGVPCGAGSALVARRLRRVRRPLRRDRHRRGHPLLAAAGNGRAAAARLGGPPGQLRTDRRGSDRRPGRTGTGDRECDRLERL